MKKGRILKYLIQYIDLLNLEGPRFERTINEMNSFL